MPHCDYSRPAICRRQQASARRTIEEAIELSLGAEERGSEADARFVFGRILEAGGQNTAAAAPEQYSRARALADQLGMQILVAHCDANLARLYQLSGDREQARHHFATATTLYRRLGMARELEKLDADMAAAGSASRRRG